MADVEIVFFDLETTGLSKEDEIIQIAACTVYTSFNVYITPTRPVHRRASEVTGLRLFKNKLFLHGNRVHSIPAHCAFADFMDYLNSFNSNVILIAHNCFGFDMPRILDLAEEVGFLNEFEDVVSGFSDSLLILKSVLKGRGGKGSFTLEGLVRDYLPNHSTNSLHNAEHDVNLLLELLYNSKLNPISDEQIIQSSKSIEEYFAGKESKMQVAQAKESLEYYNDILPTWVINKMAKAKIDGDLLRETYQEDGFEGVRRLFSQNHYGKPCVTNNKNIIRNICSSLDSDLHGDTEPSYETDSSSDYY